MPVKRRKRIVPHIKGHIGDGLVVHEQNGGALHAQMVNVLNRRHTGEGNHIPLQGGFAHAAGIDELLDGHILRVMLIDVHQHAAQSGQYLLLILTDVPGGRHVAAVAGQQGGNQSAHGGEVALLEPGGFVDDGNDQVE